MNIVRKIKKLTFITFLILIYHKSNGQTGSTFEYNVHRAVRVTTCSSKLCNECCFAPSYNFTLPLRRIRLSTTCQNRKRFFTFTDDERKVRCVLINDSLIKKRYITPDYTYATINFGIQWNESRNKPVAYHDFMYGVYINLATTRSITIPVGLRTGLGIIADNKLSLAFKSELLTGCYVKKIESFASINFGYMKTESLNGNFIPYLSFGISKLLIDGQYPNRNN